MSTSMQSPLPEDRTRRGDILATVVIAAVFLAYLLAAVLAPKAFGRPVFAGGHLPWGLLGGMAIMVFVMVAALLYMVVRNRMDREEGEA